MWQLVGVKECFQIALFFLFYTIVWFLWLLFGIRCPSCKRAPVFRILRTSDANRWVATLLELSACPLCGDKGDSEGKLEG